MANADASAPTTPELRQLVRAPARTRGRSEAFLELVAREPRGLDRTLISIALDPEVDQAMRVKATSALGRHDTPSALNGLREAVVAEDPAVARRAVERLGKVGAPDDLDRLTAIRSGDRSTLRALRTAQCFLSYRHRLGAYRVDEPKLQLSAESDEVTTIRTGTPTKSMLERMAAVAPRVPGLRLADRPARRLVCGPREFALMLNREIVEAEPSSVLERQAIPAVLVMYNDETGMYDPAYYLTTDPIRGERFRISGMRGSGRLGLHGTGVISGLELSFEINATDTPLDHPLTVRGAYDLGTGRLRFSEATIEPRFSDLQQRRRRQPRRVDRPGPPPAS